MDFMAETPTGQVKELETVAPATADKAWNDVLPATTPVLVTTIAIFSPIVKDLSAQFLRG